MMYGEGVLGVAMVVVALILAVLGRLEIALVIGFTGVFIALGVGSKGCEGR